MREGATDSEIKRELKTRSHKGAIRSDYVRLTVENARAMHDEHAPVRVVVRARIQHLPGRFAKSDRFAVLVDLLDEDTGEIVLSKHPIVMPSSGYEHTARTWEACFPDVEPARLTLRSREARVTAFRSVTWRGRTLRVALRNGEVEWIRAATTPPTKKKRSTRS
jgi:hypothetical protein